MYKSKLQEVCQKEKWALPKYTCVRDGADHCPQFKASVVVAGATFHAPSAANSYKQALNHVAQLAFLHFTSQHSDQNVVKETCGKEVESSESSEDKSSKNLDWHEGFKNKLKMYAKRKDLHQPEYHTEKEGHCFKATVSVGEDSFTSNELCATAEEAQNSAAATALLALLTDALHENEARSYKILLHKLTRDEGFFPPLYKTKGHQDSFSTTVEVEGEVFEGAAFESEKLAELDAAKAAYTALIERKMYEPPCEVVNLERRLDLCGISDPREISPICGSPSSPISDTKHGVQVQDTIGKSEGRGDEIHSKSVKSYLLNNRVRVFTCMPNMALPKGTVALPISEDQWAVVALEFPKERAAL